MVILAVVPYLYLRRRDVVLPEWQTVVVAIPLVLVPLLMAIAALSRVLMTWTTTRANGGTFADFPALEELWIGGNLLTAITPLADRPSLTGVDLEGSDQVIGMDALRARNIYVGGFA